MSNPQIFTSVINSYLPEPQASLLNGIIFGIPLKTSKLFYSQVKIVGLLHLVVLSGTNISILTGTIAAATKFFGKRVSILITILMIILFVIFVGPQAPVIRAAFMASCTFVAIFYGLVNYTLYAMFLSIIFIIIFWPQWIRTVSFQLSYAATLGMILFTRKTNQQNNEKTNKLLRFIKDNLKITFSAQIFSIPIIFYYFKEVSFISPVANLLIAPVIPSLMVFGFATAFLGKINYFLGLIPSYICYGILTYAVFIIDLLSRIPFAYFQFSILLLCWFETHVVIKAV